MGVPLIVSEGVLPLVMWYFHEEQLQQQNNNSNNNNACNTIWVSCYMYEKKNLLKV